VPGGALLLGGRGTPTCTLRPPNDERSRERHPKEETNDRDHYRPCRPVSCKQRIVVEDEIAHVTHAR